MPVQQNSFTLSIHPKVLVPEEKEETLKVSTVPITALLGHADAASQAYKGMNINEIVRG
jgi:hypothetical protein